MVLTRRSVCLTCLRPRATCLCSWVRPTPHATEVIILQHPLEVHHAKNTARLLHLSLPNSRIVVGEAFDANVLQAVTSPSGSAPVPLPKVDVLLYPPTPGDVYQEPALLNEAQLRDPTQVRLVVLDATWRKSRKMLHRSPALQQLPRLALHEVPTSRYLVRKAHAPGQLSTLEATVAALAQLTGDEARWVPLLQAFDGWIAQQELLMQKKGL